MRRKLQRRARALIAVFAMQLWAASLCAMPAAWHHAPKAAPVAASCATMDASSPQQNPAPSACAHCDAPEAWILLDAPLQGVLATAFAALPEAPASLDLPAKSAQARFFVPSTDSSRTRLYRDTLRLRI